MCIARERSHDSENAKHAIRDPRRITEMFAEHMFDVEFLCTEIV